MHSRLFPPYRSPYRRVIGSALCLLGTLLSPALAVTPPTLDQSLISSAADQLYVTAKQAVQNAGGNLEKQHAHWVFAFSTGHFSKDPTMAEAARAVAARLASEHLAAGDQVSAAAWEMAPWNYAGSAAGPFTVPADRTALNEKLQGLWPLSPKAASIGGHDTERAIAELTSQYGEEGDVVLILLTNTAASVSATREQQPIGQNAPAYQKALNTWRREGAQSASGASATLQFAVQGKGTRTLDAVIVVPRAFSGTLLPVARDVPAPASGGLPWWTWVLGVLALLGIAVLVIRTRNNQGLSGTAAIGPVVASPTPGPARSSGSRKGLALSLTLGGQSLPLAAIAAGDEVCVLCGPGYPTSGALPVIILRGADLPAERLATVTREKAGLKLTPAPDITLGGDLTQPIPLKAGEYSGRISGRAPRLNLPPKSFQTEIRFELNPTENP